MLCFTKDMHIYMFMDIVYF